jgi:hypothetical protein
MAVSLLGIQSDDGMSDELERVWKEVVTCLINVLSQHFLGGTGENTTPVRIAGFLVQI